MIFCHHLREASSFESRPTSQTSRPTTKLVVSKSERRAEERSLSTAQISIRIESNTLHRICVTNMYSLTPATTCLFDRLWKDGNEDDNATNFFDKCKRVLNGGRLSSTISKKLGPRFKKWRGWKKAWSHDRDHLPDFHAVLEYIARRVFRGLFGRDGKVVFEWYIEYYATKMTVTRVLIEAAARSKPGSREKNTHVRSALQFLTGTCEGNDARV